MEGWARVRIAGQTDWKRVWIVVSAGHESEAATPAASVGATPVTVSGKKKRMSNLFRDASPQRLGPTKANVSMYISQKPKDRRKALLTMEDVTQAFAVYPERPELISRSTLIKIEGRIGTEDVAAGMRGREGWILIMPELEGGLSQAAEMLKWVVGALVLWQPLFVFDASFSKGFTTRSACTDDLKLGRGTHASQLPLCSLTRLALRKMYATCRDHFL